MTAGAIGVLLNWASKTPIPHPSPDNPDSLDSFSGPVLSETIIAAFGGSFITRHCARQAYLKHYRSTVTSDLLLELPEVIQEHFPLPVEPDHDLLDLEHN